MTHTEPKPPQSPGPRENPFITFPDPTGIELSWDPELSRSTLLLDAEVVYPTAAFSEGAELAALLLPDVNSGSDNHRRTLLLPENFVTLGQALNDVTSGAATESAIEVGENLFDEIGNALSSLLEKDGLAPIKISYQNFVLSREHHEPKLLPPVQLAQVEPSDKELIKARVIDTFWESFEQGMDSDTQREMIPELFERFIKAFGG